MVATRARALLNRIVCVNFCSLSKHSCTLLALPRTNHGRLVKPNHDQTGSCQSTEFSNTLARFQTENSRWEFVIICEDFGRVRWSSPCSISDNPLPLGPAIRQCQHMLLDENSPDWTVSARIPWRMMKTLSESNVSSHRHKWWQANTFIQSSKLTGILKFTIFEHSHECFRLSSTSNLSSGVQSKFHGKLGLTKTSTTRSPSSVAWFFGEETPTALLRKPSCMPSSRLISLRNQLLQFNEW